MIKVDGLDDLDSHDHYTAHSIYFHDADGHKLERKKSRLGPFSQCSIVQFGQELDFDFADLTRMRMTQIRADATITPTAICCIDIGICIAITYQKKYSPI